MNACKGLIHQPTFKSLKTIFWILGCLIVCSSLSLAQDHSDNDEDSIGCDHHSSFSMSGGEDALYSFYKSTQIDCNERVDQGYVDGRSFEIGVVSIDGKPVERETANAYWLMQEAAEADGVYLSISSGFRTYSEQEYFYNCYINCNCNQCNLAARPGYSNHQSGHALDLNTSQAGVYDWLEQNASRFGFSRTVPSEPWHWEWWGGGRFQVAEVLLEEVAALALVPAGRLALPVASCGSKLKERLGAPTSRASPLA